MRCASKYKKFHVVKIDNKFIYFEFLLRKLATQSKSAVTSSYQKISYFRFNWQSSWSIRIFSFYTLPPVMLGYKNFFFFTIWSAVIPKYKSIFWGKKYKNFFQGSFLGLSRLRLNVKSWYIYIYIYIYILHVFEGAPDSPYIHYWH